MGEKYELSKIAIDSVILTIKDNKLKVFLHKREKEPFSGKKELPGGLLLNNESAEDTLKRKLEELVGTKNIFLKQFQTFTKPDRDPRERIISIGFIALVSMNKIENENNWFDIKEQKDLAFDHKEIINSALEYLKSSTDVFVIKHFLPDKFSLNKLQEVYELLEQKLYDNRNFRKKMISSGIVQETKTLEKNVSHRPAKLFKFS